MTEILRTALPKGRLGSEIADILKKAGFLNDSFKDSKDTRKLVFEDSESGMRYFWVKPFDVPVYVERGTADIGFIGKDILLERNPDVYELLALNIGKCKICSAALNGFVDDGMKPLRAATEFPNIARDYYSGIGREIDIIPIRGSAEIAPVLGLSDVIVDIVQTGTTLRENNLSVISVIAEVSARLIANKSAYKFKHNEIDELIRRLKEVDTNS
ncbi:MAG: ATP phosphoribosyltransferase [Synergistaceae bacterium]|nr:ATP phosphoribosyltransferase [Synergistaceae bacterium]